MCTLRRAASAAAALALALAPAVLAAERRETAGKAGDAALGTRRYSDYEKPQACAGCHVDIAREYEQAMMSQAFTHRWDEIEYFELALPHAEKIEKVKGVKAGCNGCHAPVTFLAGDIPPKRVAAGTRANEGVSCDLCHTIVDRGGDPSVNYNWISEPGKTKQGTRRDLKSPYHETRENPFLRTAEFCGTCHNEKSPWGVWVKSTQLEWREGPHGRAGIVCQDCHMPRAPGRSARMGETHPDVRQHLFHGAHDAGKLAGVAEVRVHPEAREVEPGDPIRVTAVVVNAKAGHKIPTGSAEERVLWLHVEAKDASGKVWPLRVDRKGFAGEEYTIADPKALAYQDLGDIQGIPGFRGLPRDGPVPAGDRIFRMPYFDEQGRMTIAQWNTASLGTDYRIAPLQAVTETFTWSPRDLPAGTVTVTATVWYSRLVSSVAEHLKVPAEEYAPVLVSSHTTTLTVLP
ncbi:multiheme c-type cytochrome [Anaeromyxobacter terrae]|uniref:multiheme c-type cytochrome n=1 Tax=Anaeromyxobacter terrae TaxID=2925406 RepID=UPI001F590371|nr:multiheme c-type cytochrome [Anaeromyxobacter sp. SG22]